MAIVEVDPKTNELTLTSSVRGKIGNVVFRMVNGKMVISAVPQNVKPSQSPGCVSSRGRFKATVEFAKCLNKVPIIREAWRRSEYEKCMPYNKIIKWNVNLSESGRPSVNNSITPPGNHFRIMDLILLEDNISVIMEDSFEFDDDCRLILILTVTEPHDPKFQSCEIMNVSPEISETGFLVMLNEQQSRISSRYKRFILYAAVVRPGEEMKWSDSFALEGDLE